MKCVVTGAAGFIGSHLCERLLQAGHQVAGIDAFVGNYPQAVKEANLSEALGQPSFRLERRDLRRDRLEDVLTGADCVFHLAAMPGLTPSWTDFDDYSSCNVLATQRLLEATVRAAPKLRRFLYASSSSVYGKFASGDEALPLKPISPYGVTKLAAENLCWAYRDAHELPVVALRYYSVYGPRQRPDMAYHLFIRALLQKDPLVVYGDGLQMRSNTYVADCVAGTVAAVEATPGEVYNVGGGESASVWDILRRLEAIAGRKAEVRQEPARPGDQRHTFADTGKLQRQLGWKPLTSLDEGLARQWDWQAGKG